MSAQMSGLKQSYSYYVDQNMNCKVTELSAIVK